MTLVKVSILNETVNGYCVKITETLTYSYKDGKFVSNTYHIFVEDANNIIVDTSRDVLKDAYTVVDKYLHVSKYTLIEAIEVFMRSGCRDVSCVKCPLGKNSSELCAVLRHKYQEV